MTPDSPRYRHTCRFCRFLGTLGLYDLYICTIGLPGYTLSVRTKNRDETMYITPGSRFYSRLSREHFNALRRAMQQGYLRSDSNRLVPAPPDL